MRRSTDIESKLKLAIDRLLTKAPLHAGILARWDISPDSRVGTMAIAFKGSNGRFRLLYSPDFVESLPVAELVSVLHHEINHVLFGHVYHVPEADEDTNARLIAEEITVNEWIDGPLPEGVVTLDQYPQLPESESTDTRYERLRQEPEERDEGDSDNSREPSIKPLDDHSQWPRTQSESKAAEAAAKLDIAIAWGVISAKDRRNIGEAFKARVQEATRSYGMGTGAFGDGTESQAIDLSIGRARISWQERLRSYAGKVLAMRPMLGRPPRRFPELTGIIPGKGRFCTRPRVLAVIDTSGSMTPAMLADISAELGVMARVHEVTVVECDTDIQSVYPYKPIASVTGRGGTSFIPPLAAEFLREHRPDLILYFTDGEGPAPEEAPSVPLAWCLTEGGTKPCEWGDVLELVDPETDPFVLDIGDF